MITTITGWFLQGRLITTAVDGHADWNSTDTCTLAGTSDRAIRTNPNLGKKPSAVVVSKYTAGAPRTSSAARDSAQC